MELEVKSIGREVACCAAVEAPGGYKPLFVAANPLVHPVANLFGCPRHGPDPDLVHPACHVLYDGGNDFAPVAPSQIIVLAVVIIVEASGDRKSTRLNSSHVAISYAVFCLKKKNLL